jgi:hypothetical protein
MNFGRKSCFGATSSTMTLRWRYPGSSLRVLGEKPASNRLGYVTAFLRETGGLDIEKSVQKEFQKARSTTLHLISLPHIHAQSRVSALTGANRSFSHSILPRHTWKFATSISRRTQRTRNTRKEGNDESVKGFSLLYIMCNRYARETRPRSVGDAEMYFTGSLPGNKLKQLTVVHSLTSDAI